MMFGPEYPKIESVFKRMPKGVIMPGEWRLPEFEYLKDLPWIWTEKVDGTNIRLHWDGSAVTIGGRSENAQLPAPLVVNLRPVLAAERWEAVFTAASTGARGVTVYGEGYGAGIQSSGVYSPDQRLIVFDVRIGEAWLTRDDVKGVTAALGLEVVPEMPAPMSLVDAVYAVEHSELCSHWDGVHIEGVVGRPAVDLYRWGDRLVTKIKGKDFDDMRRRAT